MKRGLNSFRTDEDAVSSSRGPCVDGVNVAGPALTIHEAESMSGLEVLSRAAHTVPP